MTKDSVRSETAAGPWPALPLTDWADSYATLHRWLQLAGKTRLALAPAQNHWWHTTLYLTTRGLGTSPIPLREESFEIEFDFTAHRLELRTSTGALSVLPFGGHSVASFFRAYRDLLAEVEIDLRIWPMPVELPDPVRFDRDYEHAAYDPDAVHRCWRILLQADRVLKEFRGEFLGKCSPVHFWWGAFDVACTRFSGRGAPAHPGGVPNLADHVAREAYSHECISAGWWPGTLGGPIYEPAFYAYVYPEPPGCPEARVQPEAARYDLQLREWVLPYDAVRSASDPDRVLLDFLRSTYTAAADLAAWPRAELERMEPAPQARPLPL